MTATLFAPANEAVISDDGIYRYSLTRVWDTDLPRVCFIMLNPSVADASKDDPTIRRCRNLSKTWGFGSLEVVNLFAFRATMPHELLSTPNPIGYENNAYILAAVARAAKVVVAWGHQGSLLGQSKRVTEMIGECFCVNKTRSGEPGHPLYVSSKCKLVPYERWEDQ